MRFRTKTVLGVAIIEIALLAVLISSVLSVLRDSNQAELVRRVQLGGKLLASAAKEALLAQDLATLDSLANETIASHQIAFVRILDAKGITLAEKGEASYLHRTFHRDVGINDPSDEIYDWSAPIMAGGIQYGEVQLSVSTKPLAALLGSAKRWAASIAALEMLLVAVFSWLLGSYLARQLVALRNASSKISAGDFDHRIEVSGSDELAETALAFNRMAEKLGESHDKLNAESRLRLQTLENLEIALAQKEDRTEQLNAIFSLSPDGFVSFDENFCVKYANPAFFHMTHLNEEDILGVDEQGFCTRIAKECYDTAMFPGIEKLREERIKSDSDASGIGKSESRQRHLIELKSAGKRVLEVEYRLSDAKTVSQIIYFRDVSHETEVDRIKSEFLATAAHELRSPLSSIYGYSELLLSRNFAVEMSREITGIIFRQAGQMVTIINELLDLARIEARRGKDFNIIRLNLNVLLSEIVNDYSTPQERFPINLTLKQSHWTRADPEKLKQAINNVLSNAYKYSTEGTEVSMELIENEKMFGIRISDHGIGMIPEQLSRVCERFYRADASGAVPGTGLGMSITKEIIELHGGHLEITSATNVGTNVTLWLPSQNK